MEPRDLNMPAIAEPYREKHMPAFRAMARNLLKQGLADGDHHSKMPISSSPTSTLSRSGFADGIALRRRASTMAGYEAIREQDETEPSNNRTLVVLEQLE